MNDKSLQKQKAEKLLALHHSDKPLLLPNIWEPLGAALLENMGYEAVATSSSAVALTNGLLDGEKISFSNLLALLKNITRAVSIPVTADVEKGYAANDEELANNIKAFLGTGIVGINFEDGDKETGGLVPIEIQCERIKLIRKAAAEKGIPLVLNARTDTYIHGNLFDSRDAQLEETIQRGKAYREAGADCFFPILVKEEKAIKTIVEQVPLPVNIMTLQGIPSLRILETVGVKRISLGSSFLKIAFEAMKREAELLKDFNGQDKIEKNEITSDYLESLITKTAG